MSVNTSSTRNIAFAACIAFAVLYAWLAVRNFEAARLASSLDIASLERAIAGAPGHAGYQDLLCRFQLFDKQDPAAALPHCQRATELDPYHSTYWLDLALAYYSTGDEREQEAAILKAVSVDPMTPDVAWTAANFFLTQGKVPQALQQFAVAMRGDPSKVLPALDLCWRALHDPAALQAILPPDPEAYLQFIRLLIANQQWDAAHNAWSAMWQLNRPVDYSQALFYVDGLLVARDVARAQEAWQYLAARSPELNAYRGSDGLVVNGGFEEPILNAGFDWHYDPQPGIAIALTPEEHHSGSQSLMVSFNGVGGDSGMLQYVSVKPNTSYALTAWIKSDRVDAANGPVLSVWDTFGGEPISHTPETLGTTVWHQLQTSFQTGPQTELVTLRITRDPATTHIAGKIWVDDIELRPAPATQTPAR